MRSLIDRGPLAGPNHAIAGAATALLLATTTQVQAFELPVETIASWSLFGVAGDIDFVPATSSAAGVAGLNLTRGSGLQPNGASDSFNSRDWDEPEPGTPGLDDNYLSFGFTVDAGYSVDLDELIIATRSSSTGPGTLGLYYSIDGFAAPLHTFTQSGSAYLNSVVDLSTLDALTGTVELRIIEIGNTQADGSGATAAGGTFRITDYYDGSYTDTQLTGTVTSGAPDTTPPAVSGTAPNSGETGVLVDIGEVTITFNEPLQAVDLSGADVQCPTGTSVSTGAGVSGSKVTFTVASPLPYDTSCSVNLPAGALTDLAGNPAPAVSFGFSTEQAVACGSPATLISQIQGEGTASPLVGQIHTIEGVVVGDFQPTDGTGLSGFFVQEEDADSDGNPATSEGIFVFYPANSVEVEAGDIVRVTGSVQERFDSTQLTNVDSVEVCTDLTGTATPAVVSLPLPNDPETDLEPVEGMAVDVIAASGDLTLVEYFNLDRFGEIRVASGGRPYQFTHDFAPDAAGYAAHLDEMARRTLLIDDGRSGQNLDPVYFGRGGQPLQVAVDPQNLLRGGDTVSLIQGVMGYGFGVYRVQPVTPPSFAAGNDRPSGVPDVGGGLKVVSYNVLNYFQQLDDAWVKYQSGTPKCGPPTNPQSCRGADEYDWNLGPPNLLLDGIGRNERDRQEEKLIPALLKLGADIYGLVELENDFGAGATSSAQNLADLMNSYNAANGVTDCSTYAAVDPGDYVGADVIAVAILFCADTVGLAPGTSVEILDDSDLAGLGLDHLAPVFNGEASSRASLAATFVEAATGGVFTVAVNHFKSKGASGLPGDYLTCQVTPGVSPNNCDQGDGQGFWNQRRLDAAVALDAWLSTQPTGTSDPDVLILGDLNAYAKEDPVAYLEGQGYENLVDSFGGADAYSFLFDAQLGYLDYAMANGPLATQITGAAEWHINADEPDALDYDISFNPDTWYREDEFRTSDHDPVIVGIALQPALVGDLDGDGDIDRDDVAIVTAARNAPAAPGDPRDLNGDGVITVVDARMLVLSCTRPRCASE